MKKLALSILAALVAMPLAASAAEANVYADVLSRTTVVCGAFGLLGSSRVVLAAVDEPSRRVDFGLPGAPRRPADSRHKPIDKRRKTSGNRPSERPRRSQPRRKRT